MGRGVKFVLFLMFLIIPVPACANSWQTDQKNFNRNALVEEATAPEDLSVQWTKTPALTANSNFQMPIYQDGIFYFSEESGVTDSPRRWTVYAVSKRTGNEIWRKNGQGSLRCSPSVSGGIIVIPGENMFVLDSKTGNEIWQKQASSGYFYIHPMISGDKLLVVHKDPSYSGSIKSLNLMNGSENWSKSLYLYGYNPPTIYGGNVLMTTGLPSNFSIVTSFRMSDGGQNWTYKRSYNPNGPTVVDEERGIGLLSSAVNCVTVIDLETGLAVNEFGVGSYNSSAILIGDIAYFISYQSGDTYFNACNYITGGCSIHEEIADGQVYEPRIVPTVVGGRFYFPSRTGRLYEINIGDGSARSFPVADPPAVLTYSIYADGAFVVSDFYYKKLYILGNGAEPITVESSVELDSPYKNDGEYYPYLGQLHSHYIPDVALWSKIFNGEPTPSFTEDKYKEAGYDFIALTEHNKVIGDPGVGGILHIANAEEDTQDQGGNHILALGIQNSINESLDDQTRINNVVSQGGVPILAHPNSKQYPWTMKSLLDLNNFSTLEVKNKAISWLDPTGFAGNSLATNKWDSLLSARKKVYGTAGDDYTPGDGGFDGGAVVVFSKNKVQLEILENLKSGNFYALQGSEAPRINITTQGNQIIVISDRQSTFRFISRGEIIKKIEDVDTAYYTASGGETYIRVEVESSNKKAWSQPIFVSLKQSAKTPFPGGYKINLSEGNFLSKNTNQVDVEALSSSQYPPNSPDLGYLSQVYSLSSSSAPLAGTKLTLSYKDKQILTNEINLSIYGYSAENNEWQKVQGSIVDIASQSVTAPIADSSLYTLSAEEADDTTPPTIDLTSPLVIDGSTGKIEIMANDNNAVIKTSFYIDDDLVAEDMDKNDDWTADININEYANGEHKLLITAEDLSGNIGQKEYLITIVGSAFVTPLISVSNSSISNDLWEESLVSGTFSSNLPVATISLFLDDYFLGRGDVSGDNFSKEIDWSAYKEGDHILKVVLKDSRGNLVQDVKEIHIEEGIRVVVASPAKNTYFQSDKIVFSINANKENVTVKLDGNIIENNSERLGYELGLGKHRLYVEYDGSTIAEKELIITTSLADLQAVVGLLYSSGHVSDLWTCMSLQFQFEYNERFMISSLQIKKSSLLSRLMLIEARNRMGKVDNYGALILKNSILFLIKNL